MTGAVSKRQLVFATRNRGKIEELQLLLSDTSLELLSLDDIQVPEVVEDGATFEANAKKKAREVALHTRLPALADDSGLEVDALDGRPGVYSARYAGPDATDAENNAKLLLELKDSDARKARFRSALAFADPLGALGERILVSKGSCEGTILREARGDGGFGYDPLFFSSELGATFAEVGNGPKNQLSHRARAMKAMRKQLCDYFGLKSSS